MSPAPREPLQSARSRLGAALEVYGVSALTPTVRAALSIALALAIPCTASASDRPETAGEGCYTIKNQKSGYLRYKTSGDGYESGSLDSHAYFRLLKTSLADGRKFMFLDNAGNYVENSRELLDSVKKVSHAYGPQAEWKLVYLDNDWYHIEADDFLPDRKLRWPGIGGRVNLSTATWIIEDLKQRSRWKFTKVDESLCTQEHEPSLDCTASPCPSVPKGDPSAPVVGYADLHNHMFGNLMGNAGVISGTPFHPMGPGVALRACEAEHGIRGLRDFVHDDSPLNGKDGHQTEGFPGQVRADTTHQRSYHSWLERAHRGGLKLVVVSVVNERAACALEFDPLLQLPLSFLPDSSMAACGDDQAIEKQLIAFDEMVKWIDLRSGGPGKGWLQRADDPGRARQLIADGKLAVVIGTESAELFNCGKEAKCDAAYLQASIDAYYKRGVRYVFPMHGLDNAFGGPAIFNSAYPAGQCMVSESGLPETEACAGEGPYGTDNNYDLIPLNVPPILDPITPKFLRCTTSLQMFPGQGTCNARGLTTTGKELIQRLMEKGMMIDVDHMSYRTLSGVFDIAEKYGYPLNSSHTEFSELKPSGMSEHNRSRSDIIRIGELGGALAPLANQRSRGAAGALVPGRPLLPPPWDQVVFESSSSAAFLQSMIYANHLTGRGVAIGTDANGAAHMPHGTGRLTYPFTMPAALGGVSFEQLQRGNYGYFDVKEEMATVGLLPDFIADAVQAHPTVDMSPFYTSAEMFLQTWERSTDKSIIAQAGVTEVSGSATATTGGSPESYQFDFGSPRTFASIHMNVRQHAKYVVEVSGDGSNWSTVHDYTRIFCEGSCKAHLARPRARYLRVRITAVENPHEPAGIENVTVYATSAPGVPFDGAHADDAKDGHADASGGPQDTATGKKRPGRSCQASPWRTNSAAPTWWTALLLGSLLRRRGGARREW